MPGPEVKLIRVNEELREVKELRNKFLAVTLTSGGAVETVVDVVEVPVRVVEPAVKVNMK